MVMGGGGWKDGRTDGQTFRISPIVFYRTLALWGRSPEKKQSPEGNMRSAIPVALICMLIIVGDCKQGRGPKGDDCL